MRWLAFPRRSPADSIPFSFRFIKRGRLWHRGPWLHRGGRASFLGFSPVSPAPGLAPKGARECHTYLRAVESKTK